MRIRTQSGVHLITIGAVSIPGGAKSQTQEPFTATPTCATKDYSYKCNRVDSPTNVIRESYLPSMDTSMTVY